MNNFRKISKYRRSSWFTKLGITTLLLITSLLLANPTSVYAMAADCVLERNTSGIGEVPDGLYTRE